jgi:bifunctional non-homologous end joining protein LigD
MQGLASRPCLVIPAGYKIAMSLSRYQRKRDFQQTSEPRGGRGRKSGWQYVVQKHAASHLHYDFRLQIGGVLKSWAVPKGPSLDPDVKRLAMHVEDHPLEYGSFEGTIPKGQYGGGTVMLWDQGTWQMDEDPEQAYRQGKLHFTLHGQKLRGEWVLVKRSGGSGTRQNGGRYGDGGKEPWFLFKIRDGEARKGDEDGVLEREPNSAASGRTLDEIAAGKRVWHSNRKNGKPSGEPKHRPNGSVARSSRTAVRPASPASRKRLLAEIAGAKPAPLPRNFRPQLATLVKQAPSGDEWYNEIKFDGYRMLSQVERREVKFSSRNGLDWTARVPHLVQAVRGLGVGSALFDGEVVALDPDGRSSFQGLQNSFADKRANALVYYVFDLLYLDGVNLTKVNLDERKRLLATIIGDGLGPVRDAGFIVGKGPEFFAEACHRRLEGIICKRRDRPYRSGRGTEWLKVKCSHNEEFVIGGFTPPAGSRVGFGALLLGYYDEGQLRYAGRVGTGFSDALLEDLAKRLNQDEQKESPFVDLQGRTGQARGVHWVKPKLVAQVTFGEWTRDGHLRHPSFQGLREDKPAVQVTRERPVPLKAVEQVSMSKSAASKPVGKRKAKASANGKGLSVAPVNNIPASVRLTNPEKLLYADDGITKAQLAGYYASVADWILPHLVDRPLTLVRCPQGYQGKCFYQKHADKGLPDVLGRVTIAEKRQKIQYPVVKNLEGLLSLVQMNTLEIHAWGARVDNVEKPDRLVFDLDPDPSVPWKRVVESAQQMRAFFADLGLESFVKTTGGKGLHLVLPIERRTSWDDAKAISLAIADAVAAADPARYTTNMSKAARGGKIYLDYLRNGRGATAVVAYSTRARQGCPIATPISWEELSGIKSPGEFTIANVPARLAGLKRDPWRELDTTRQALPKSLLKKLAGKR